MSIYGLCDPHTKEIRYVGKTGRRIPKRYQAHMASARRGKARSHVYCWIRSLLARGLEPICIQIDAASSNTELSDLEQHWIAYFRSLGAQLTNHTGGGDNHLLGTKLSDEHKEKIRQSSLIRKNWSISPTGRASINASKEKLRGRKKAPLSTDHRAKISAGNKGKKRSPEQRARISTAAKRRWQ